MDDGFGAGKMVLKAVVLACAGFLMIFGPPGCSKKAGDTDGNGGQADRVKTAPSGPIQDSLAKPRAPGQGGAGVMKTAPAKSGKTGDEEDQEEPESEPDDD